MKYFRVIYNSSKSGRSGSVGFSVRTATEGIPEDYLELLEDQGFFAYNSGDVKKVTASELLENPEAIKRYPKSLTYRNFTVNGKKIYVLSRAVYIGFDYPFYETNEAARLGNYIVDSLIFEDGIEPSLFNVLTNCNPDSTHFEPIDNAPRFDNEDIRKLSLGKSEPLPVCDFIPPQNEPTRQSDKAFDLLYAYLDAKESNKRLCVIEEDDKTERLLSEFISLIGAKRIQDTSFVTNYQGMGLKKDIDIAFINEFNANDKSSMKSLAYMVDFTSRVSVSTSFKERFDNALKNCAKHNPDKLRDLLNWILDNINEISHYSKETFKCMLSYQLGIGEFHIEDVFNNHEVNSIFANKKEDSLDKYYDDLNYKIEQAINSHDIKKAIQLYENNMELVNRGMAFNENIKHGICEKFSEYMTSSEKITEVYKNLKNASILFSEKTIKEALGGKKEFMCSPCMKPYWKDLYPLFYGNPKDVFVKFVIDILSSGFDGYESVFDDIVKDPTQRIDNYMKIIDIIGNDRNIEKKLVELIIRNKGSRTEPYIVKFANKKGDPRYNELFLYDLTHQSVRDVDDCINEINELISWSEKDDILKNELRKEITNPNGCYQNILFLFERNYKINYKKIAEPLKDFISFFNIKDTKWNKLYEIIKINIEIKETPQNDISGSQYIEKLKLAVSFNDNDTIESLLKQVDYSKLDRKEQINDFIDIAFDKGRNVINEDCLFDNVRKINNECVRAYYMMYCYKKNKKGIDWVLNKISYLEIEKIESAVEYNKDIIRAFNRRIMGEKRRAFLGRIWHKVKGLFYKKKVEKPNDTQGKNDDTKRK